MASLHYTEAPHLASSKPEVPGSEEATRQSLEPAPWLRGIGGV